MFKEIKVAQGSPEWLAWRRTVITATDASIIMGNNPWETPYMCWQRKLGIRAEKESNAAMERGKALEPEAREQFIEYYAIPMQPMVVESTEFDFLGASLDGISEDGDLLLEVKCGSAKLHSMAKNREIPPYYLDQMQHQLLVTGAKKCFYYSYDGEDGVCVEVFPDPKFKETFLPKAREFWKCVALSEPPALQRGDYKDRSQDEQWSKYASLYREEYAQLKASERRVEEYRQILIDLAEGENSMGDGVKLVKSIIRGKVSYDDIPELLGVDLDKYRKESKATFKIFVS